MGGRAVSVLGLVGAGLLLSTFALAQERSAPAGAVVVRPVRVREVRVDTPAPRPTQERPTFGVERPVDPGFISRPFPGPQPPVNTPRHGNRHARGGKSSFKPRFHTGSGVVVGYPIIYPYAYPYDPFTPSSGGSYPPVAPSRNTYSNVDSLSSTSANVTAASPFLNAVQCAGAACGGVSFDISPETTQVFVDGVFMGTVDEFNDASAPLLLAPGVHYIELRLAGYRTGILDVTIAPGEVTPYQGTLDRLRLQP